MDFNKEFNGGTKLTDEALSNVVGGAFYKDNEYIRGTKFSTSKHQGSTCIVAYVIASSGCGYYIEGNTLITYSDSFENLDPTPITD